MIAALKHNCFISSYGGWFLGFDLDTSSGSLYENSKGFVSVGKEQVRLQEISQRHSPEAQYLRDMVIGWMWIMKKRGKFKTIPVWCVCLVCFSLAGKVDCNALYQGRQAKQI